MNINRRKILSGASALIPALITSRARAWSHGVLTPPPAASAFGFNTRTFFDGFDSLSTIDVADTGNPGFNWYTHGSWPAVPNFSLFQANSPTPSNKYSISNSILTLTDANTLGASLSSMHYNGNGHAFGNGAYFEGRMAAVQAVGTGNPAFWCWSKESLLGQITVNTEMDFIECFASGSQISTTIHNWASDGIANPWSTNISISQALPFVADGTFYKVGFLWVPTAKNGGTGILRSYINDVLVSAASYTYTTSSGSALGIPPGSQTDAESFVILIGNASGVSLSFDSISVWQ